MVIGRVARTVQFARKGTVTVAPSAWVRVTWSAAMAATTPAWRSIFGWEAPVWAWAAPATAAAGRRAEIVFMRWLRFEVGRDYAVWAALARAMSRGRVMAAAK